MNPQQFAIFLEQNERNTRETIERTVNGKIDRLSRKVEGIADNQTAHNLSHENDMIAVRQHIQAVSPILIEYKERKAAGDFVKRNGELIRWLAGVGTAIGVLWIMVLQLFHK
jgi:hypothetical protein